MADTHAQRPRRWPIALLALGLLTAAGAFAAWHFTRADKLTALLVGKTRDLLGANLAIGGAARFGFVPKLHLVLPKPALQAAGATVAFATADSLEASVPWHTLWSDRYDIERIDLIKPVLDLDALRAWLAARPPAPAAAPDVSFVLHVADGTIVSGGRPVAQGVKLDFASTGDVSAWLARIRAQPAAWPLLPPLSGSAEAAAVQIGATRLDGVQVEVGDDPARPPPRN